MRRAPVARGANPGPSMLTGAIKGFQSEGQSATGALRAYRDAGFGVTTQRWYQQWGGVSRAVAAAGDLAGLPGDNRLGPDQYTPWAAGRSGSYAHQVRVISHDSELGVPIEHEWTIITSDPMSPDEATAAAIDEFDQATEEGGSGEGQVVWGAVLVGAYAMTGR